MTEVKREIVRNLLAEYDIKDAHDIQAALKDLLGSTIKEMIEAEIEVPHDRKSTFETKVVKKGQKDISDLDRKIISIVRKRSDPPLDEIYPVIDIDAIH